MDAKELESSSWVPIDGDSWLNAEKRLSNEIGDVMTIQIVFGSCGSNLMGIISHACPHLQCNVDDDSTISMSENKK